MLTFPARMAIAFAMAGIFLLSPAADVFAVEDDPAFPTNEVARADDDSWSVEALGKGAYLFRWWPGLYVSPFLVGKDSVLAVDPINREAAAMYREAISRVTDHPIRKIVYSHDHRDHIVGADVLAPGAEIYAHPGTLASLEYRGDDDIPLPTHLVDDGDLIAVGGRLGGRVGGEIGGRTVRVHYFGPNHGRSNIALSFDTGAGKMLAFIDTLEIGIVPYRSLPDTNVHGYIKSLQAASTLDVQWVVGGHSGPGAATWIGKYLAYLMDMRAALESAAAQTQMRPVESVDEIIGEIERHRGVIVAKAVEALRPGYGHWQGFEAWAPMNAQTIWMAIITGN